MEATASAMDFHALSRRELQALCKRNGVRANMTNAAMADALHNLTSVDGIDEIGTTLCLPTPGRSAMKSAAKAVSVAGEEQQLGSPLPRGRRVSVMSPAAIRMDVEEGDDELKKDMVKEIVKTPGVALRSTSRRALATPAPLPTPATLRRSQRTAARKAAAPVEAENRVEEVSTAKKSTRRASARSKMMVELDQEEELAAATPKVQQEAPQALASNVQCDDPAEEEDEVSELLEPEEGEKADSSDAANGSSLLKEVVVVVEQEATKPQEGFVEEQEPISVQKSAPFQPMEDSPFLDVMSKAEATESVVEVTENDALVEDGESVAEWSSVNEMIVEISPDVEDKVEAIIEEAVKCETVHSPKEILPTAAGEYEISEEDDLIEKEQIGDEIDDEEGSLDDDESNEEIDSTDESEEGDCIEVRNDFSNVKEELVQMMQETSIAEKASDHFEEEFSEEDGSADEEASEASAEEASEEDGSVDEDASGDSEEDVFTSDLPPECDDIVVLVDAETDSDTISLVAVASATKISVKSRDNSAISVTNEEEFSEEKDVIEAAMEVANVDTIVKSLEECTIKECTQQAEEEKLYTRVEAVRQKGKQTEDYDNMSMRKLRATLKNRLSAKEEGKKHAEAKRLPLEEVDDNCCADC